jgi:hypothetical protein
VRRAPPRLTAALAPLPSVTIERHYRI